MLDNRSNHVLSIVVLEYIIPHYQSKFLKHVLKNIAAYQ